mmetsp:Transcript_10331/g.13077  ORF Transcript_10331/g.13077 Transcript_10331/m.13077 type:complete len:89 (+) Transcript_10331:194-460(+)
MTHDQAYVWDDGVKVETPNIDSLARDGVLFSSFYASSPLCTPSRASLMTGLYPKFTGAWKNHAPLNEGIPTYASALKKLKYQTGFMGK